MIKKSKNKLESDFKLAIFLFVAVINVSTTNKAHSERIMKSTYLILVRVYDT
jgi:hypothetical protein